MDRKIREEALNEVHILNSMRHPFIITYRESFMKKKNNYFYQFFMIFIYSNGLCRWWGFIWQNSQTKRTWNTFFGRKNIGLVFQMALAMNHIHEERFLYRDLKTQNIFLISKNDVKIGDFGIARVLQHTYDCAQTAIGTPYYLGPEICQKNLIIKNLIYGHWVIYCMNQLH